MSIIIDGAILKKVINNFQNGMSWIQIQNNRSGSSSYHLPNLMATGPLKPLQEGLDRLIHRFYLLCTLNFCLFLGI